MTTIVDPMTTSSAPLADGPSAAEANEAIRQYVAGRRLWTLSELTELDRLRTQWKRAVRAEMVRAA